MKLNRVDVRNTVTTNSTTLHQQVTIHLLCSGIYHSNTNYHYYIGLLAYRLYKYVFLTCTNMPGHSSFTAALATYRKTPYVGFMWLYAPSHGCTPQSVVIPILTLQLNVFMLSLTDRLDSVCVIFCVVMFIFSLCLLLYYHCVIWT